VGTDGSEANRYTRNQQFYAGLSMESTAGCSADASGSRLREFLHVQVRNTVRYVCSVVLLQLFGHRCDMPNKLNHQLLKAVLYGTVKAEMREKDHPTSLS